MEPEFLRVQIFSKMTGDPGGFVALLRSKGFDSPPVVWPIIAQVAKLASDGDNLSVVILRALFSAQLLETVSRILIENRPTRTIGTDNVSSKIYAWITLGNIFNAAHQPSTPIPPADIKRELDLPNILTVLLGEQDLWNQNQTYFRRAVLQFFMFYLESSNRWQDPCFLQVMRLISKMWMFPGGDDEAISSASSLATTFSRAPTRSPDGLTHHMGLSLDQISTRYTQIMTRKDLPPAVCIENLNFFVSWSCVDGSKTLLDHCLRSSYISQSVHFVVEFDRSGVTIPAYIRDRFSRLQEILPMVWMRIMIQSPALDTALQIVELKKCIKAGMVGWIIASLLINQQQPDPVERIGICDMMSTSLTQIARCIPALRHRILEEVKASLQNTRRDPNCRPSIGDIGHIVYLEHIVPAIQALQNNDDGSGVNGECVAPTCGRTHDEYGSDLLLCSVCHVSQYCSKECQKQDWREHKRMCREWEVASDSDNGDNVAF